MLLKLSSSGCFLSSIRTERWPLAALQSELLKHDGSKVRNLSDCLVMICCHNCSKVVKFTLLAILFLYAFRAINITLVCVETYQTFSIWKRLFCCLLITTTWLCKLVEHICIIAFCQWLDIWFTEYILKVEIRNA